MYHWRQVANCQDLYISFSGSFTNCSGFRRQEEKLKTLILKDISWKHILLIMLCKVISLFEKFVGHLSSPATLYLSMPSSNTTNGIFSLRQLFICLLYTLYMH